MATRRRIPVIAPRPPLQTGRIADLHVAGAGHQLPKTQWIHHRFGLHGVGMVVAGSGTYRVGDGPVHAIRPGCAFAVYPGPVFHYGPHGGTAWEERYVTVVGAGVKRWLDTGWLWDDGSVRELSDWTQLVDLHQRLLHVFRRAGVGDADRAVIHTERYLMELHYARAALHRTRRPSAAWEAVLEHCRLHHAQRIDFEALARRHAMSYSSLRQGLRKLTGLSPARYLTFLRCGAARALLTDTDAPVKEIAQRVGIPDPYTFSRTFKRCMGLSPEHYRRQHAP